MSRVDELEREVRDAEAKLTERQKDATYWSQKVLDLNRELTGARDEAAAEARSALTEGAD